MLSILQGLIRRTYGQAYPFTEELSLISDIATSACVTAMDTDIPPSIDSFTSNFFHVDELHQELSDFVEPIESDSITDDARFRILPDDEPNTNVPQIKPSTRLVPLTSDVSEDSLDPIGKKR